MLVRNNNQYQLVQSRHLAFVENHLPGAPDLSEVKEAEILRDESEQEGRSHHSTGSHEFEEVSNEEFSDEDKED